MGLLEKLLSLTGVSITGFSMIRMLGYIDPTLNNEEVLFTVDRIS
jgi:hypothetical protein